MGKHIYCKNFWILHCANAFCNIRFDRKAQKFDECSWKISGLFGQILTSCCYLYTVHYYTKLSEFNYVDINAMLILGTLPIAYVHYALYVHRRSKDIVAVIESLQLLDQILSKRLENRQEFKASKLVDYILRFLDCLDIVMAILALLATYWLFRVPTMKIFTFHLIQVYLYGSPTLYMLYVTLLLADKMAIFNEIITMYSHSWNSNRPRTKVNKATICERYLLVVSSRLIQYIMSLNSVLVSGS